MIYLMKQYHGYRDTTKNYCRHIEQDSDDFELRSSGRHPENVSSKKKCYLMSKHESSILTEISSQKR